MRFLLSRHWPEAIRVLDLDSVTLLSVVATYEDAQSVAAHAPAAEQLMRRTGRTGLSGEKRERLLDSHRVGRVAD